MGRRLKRIDFAVDAGRAALTRGAAHRGARQPARRVRRGPPRPRQPGRRIRRDAGWREPAAGRWPADRRHGARRRGRRRFRRAPTASSRRTGSPSERLPRHSRCDARRGRSTRRRERGGLPRRRHRGRIGSSRLQRRLLVHVVAGRRRRARFRQSSRRDGAGRAEPRRAVRVDRPVRPGPRTCGSIGCCSAIRSTHGATVRSRCSGTRHTRCCRTRRRAPRSPWRMPSRWVSS